MTREQRRRYDSLMMKFSAALVRKADGQSEQEADNFLESKLEEVKTELGLTECNPMDLPSQINLFRAAVGEDTWPTIANNPSLLDMVEKHMQQVRLSLVGKLTDKLYEVVLGRGIDKDEIEELLLLQLS